MGPLFGLHAEEVPAPPRGRATRDLIVRVADENLGEGRFAAAVAAHDGVGLALANRQRDPLQDLAAGLLAVGSGDAGLKVLYLEKDVSNGPGNQTAGTTRAWGVVRADRASEGCGKGR